MPETWYYIGPDKTGLACPDCCAAYRMPNNPSCSLPGCQVSGSTVFRDYLCTNAAFPTPYHYYSLNPGTRVATIAPNPRFCSTVSSNCYTYTPSGGLNDAGRVGSGCSQTTVTSSNNCVGSSSECELPCNAECGLVQIGGIYNPSSCEPNPSGVCACSSTSRFINTCGCECVSGPFPGGACTQCNSSDAPCYQNCSNDPDPCTLCPDGTIVCPPDTCCGSSATLPEEPCNECQNIRCSNNQYYCESKSCSESCLPGFECSCGQCQCYTESTCCVGAQAGWSWNSATKTCRSCGYSYNSPPNGCCDSAWRRKGCSASHVCCNDGRCYFDNYVLCTL